MRQDERFESALARLELHGVSPPSDGLEESGDEVSIHREEEGGGGMVSGERCAGYLVDSRGRFRAGSGTMTERAKEQLKVPGKLHSTCPLLHPPTGRESFDIP